MRKKRRRLGSVSEPAEEVTRPMAELLELGGFDSCFANSMVDVKRVLAKAEVFLCICVLKMLFYTFIK